MDKEEIKGQQPAPAKDPTSDEYIAAIQHLKETTVPKEEYEKKVAENKKLINAIATGQRDAEVAQKEATMTSDDFAKELVKRHTNLEYAQLALKQRAKAIEEGKPDPFMPHGASFKEGKADDADNANMAADFLQSIVDESDGNPAVFNSLFQARCKDDPVLIMRLAARKSANQ